MHAAEQATLVILRCPHRGPSPMWQEVPINPSLSEMPVPSVTADFLTPWLISQRVDSRDSTAITQLVCRLLGQSPGWFLSLYHDSLADSCDFTSFGDST